MVGYWSDPRGAIGRFHFEGMQDNREMAPEPTSEGEVVEINDF